MAVFRVEKNANYSVMANYHFRDKSLSWKAKGILSNMLSLPDDWDYSLAGLTTLASDGQSATRSAIKELEEHGYLIRRPIRENGKISDWEYIIFEYPQAGNQNAEMPLVENQQVENRPQLNNNQSTTNQSSMKKSSINGYSVRTASRFTPPTLEEVNAYCSERRNNVDAQRFIDYYTANGWKVGRNAMKDWKAAVRTWERSDNEKPAPNKQQVRQQESAIDRANRFLAMYEQEESENA